MPERQIWRELDRAGVAIAQARRQSMAGAADLHRRGLPVDADQLSVTYSQRWKYSHADGFPAD